MQVPLSSFSVIFYILVHISHDLNNFFILLISLLTAPAPNTTHQSMLLRHKSLFIENK